MRKPALTDKRINALIAMAKPVKKMMGGRLRGFILDGQDPKQVLHAVEFADQLEAWKEHKRATQRLPKKRG